MPAEINQSVIMESPALVGSYETYKAAIARLEAVQAKQTFQLVWRLRLNVLLVEATMILMKLLVLLQEKLYMTVKSSITKSAGCNFKLNANVQITSIV